MFDANWIDRLQTRVAYSSTQLPIATHLRLPLHRFIGGSCVHSRINDL